MKCIFCFIESTVSGWFLCSRSDHLDLNDLKFFINFYGLRNVRLKCGDYDFEDYGYPDIFNEDL